MTPTTRELKERVVRLETMLRDLVAAVERPSTIDTREYDEAVLAGSVHAAKNVLRESIE